MALEVRWTRRALRRLDEIADYIARENPGRASTFVADLRRRVAGLSEQSLGKASRVDGTREWVLHRHYVVGYRVRENEVQVLTVLHTSMGRST